MSLCYGQYNYIKLPIENEIFWRFFRADFFLTLSVQQISQFTTHTA